MGKFYGFWVVLYSTVALKRWSSVEGELVLLVTLTRHGSRAPNTVIDELCPANEANRRSYNVPPGQLTEKGMQQALKLGEFVRKTYVESMAFLPPTLGSGGSSGTYSSSFMSDSADRCLQTAQVMAMGLFPNGTGPPGFPNQPVAVQTEQKQFANVLAAAHGACLGQQKADNKVYDQTRGKDLIDDAKNVTETVAKACGARVEDYKNADGGKEGLVLGVKDVADMLDFDEQQGLPRLASVSKQTHEEMTALAFTLLQERYYSSRQQITYWAGDLPTQLLEDFKSASKRHSKGDKPNRLYIGYHGHRELLYGLAHLLGWRFKVEGMPKALGTSSIPPTTTMFFELHYRNGEEIDQADPGDDDAALDDDGAHSSVHSKQGGGGGGGGGGGRRNASVETGGEEGYYYVRTYTWTPDLGQQEVVLDFCSDIPAGTGCPLSAFKDAVLDSIVDVGSWQDICHHVPFTQAEELAQQAVYDTGGHGEGVTDSTTDDNTDSITDDNTDGTTYSDSERNADQERLSLTIKICAVAATLAAGIVVWVGALAVRATWMNSEGLRGESYQIVP